MSERDRVAQLEAELAELRLRVAAMEQHGDDSAASQPRPTRRQLLRTAGVAAAAGSLGAMGLMQRPAAADNGNAVTVGNTTTGTRPTTVAVTSGQTLTDGTGVLRGDASSASGGDIDGVQGTGKGTYSGVAGFGGETNGTGVFGKGSGSSGCGVRGIGAGGTNAVPANPAGVFGRGGASDTGVGVWGQGAGIYGKGLVARATDAISVGLSNSRTGLEAFGGNQATDIPPGAGGVLFGGFATTNAFSPGVGAVGYGGIGVASGGIGVVGKGGTSSSGLGGVGVQAEGGGGTGSAIRLLPQPGPDSTKSHAVGEMWMTNAGSAFVCTTSGSPPVWSRVADVKPRFGSQLNAGGTINYLPQPIRLRDTRSGAKLAPGSTSEIDVNTAVAGISVPEGAVGVIGNITVIATSGPNGYLTVYPKGPVPTSNTATINWFGANQILNNAFTSRVDNTGVLVVHNGLAGGSAPTHFTLDIVAFVI